MAPPAPDHAAHDPARDATPDVPGARDELAAALRTIANLETALDTSRTIGMAVGIVMERLRITADAAFEVLRTISQRRHLKVRELADELVFSGHVTGLDDHLAQAG